MINFEERGYVILKLNNHWLHNKKESFADVFQRWLLMKRLKIIEIQLLNDAEDFLKDKFIMRLKLSAMATHPFP